MTAFKPFTVLLIALSCYAFCGYSKSIRHDIEKTRTTESEKMKVPAANQIHINSESSYPHMKMSPRIEGRQKRSQYDFINDYNSNNNVNELSDEILLEDAQPPNPTQSTLQRTNDDYEVESLPPLTYFLLLQKLKQLQSQEPTYRVRTPRLGRSIDLQMLDDIGAGSGLLGRAYDIGGSLTRLSKKSVPFKPRLGKRTKYCD